MDNKIEVNEDFDQDDANCFSYDLDTGVCMQTGEICDACSSILKDLDI